MQADKFLVLCFLSFSLLYYLIDFLTLISILTTILNKSMGNHLISIISYTYRTITVRTRQLETSNSEISLIWTLKNSKHSENCLIWTLKLPKSQWKLVHLGFLHLDCQDLTSFRLLGTYFSQKHVKLKMFSD